MAQWLSFFTRMLRLQQACIFQAAEDNDPLNVATNFPRCPGMFQVEASNYEQAAEAASAGADIVMLDNFEPAELSTVSRRLKDEYPHTLLEASGGITGKTFHLFLVDTIDVISQGALTHGYPCLDFSLKITPK